MLTRGILLIMPRASILPLLLLVALVAFLWPTSSGSTTSSVAITVPSPLSARQETVFRAARPSSVVVRSLDVATGMGGVGTGFFINEQGQLLTAYHVVSGGELFSIMTLDGRRASARVVGFDAAQDIALLQTDRLYGPGLSLTTRAPRSHDLLLAIGNSGGDFLQPRIGELTSLDTIPSRTEFPQRTLELNMPLAPGDSGGPVLNMAGEVVGVTSYVRLRADGTTARAFAVPVSSALLAELQRGQKRHKAVVGMILDTVHTHDQGVVIQRVFPGSAAARAGLHGCKIEGDQLVSLGDVIVEINGIATLTIAALLTELEKVLVGKAAEVVFLRDGERKTTKIIPLSEEKSDNSLRATTICDP